MDVNKHVSIVAALQIIFGILGVLGGLLLFFVIVGGGILSNDSEAITVTSVVGSALGGGIALLAIPKIVGGIGLLKIKNWARILTIIVSCFDLLAIPIGTAIGGYSLWVLLHDDTGKYFQESI